MDVTERAATGRGLAFVGEIASVCERRSLAGSRTRVVFGSGNPAAELMVVGMAPGADEDETGLPFVGDAGRTLDTLLADAGLRRQDAYVTNVVKCRPPGNRPLRQHEVVACAPYLDLQLALVRPRVVLAVGASATERLTGRTTPLERIHGDPHPVGRYTVVPTFHPSSFNRALGRRDQASTDVRAARRALDDGGVP
ncbi:MAG: uracil-DNA glycosylase [Candidatus Limnocylindrales bacterium]